MTNAVAKVSYTHDAMIDLIVANPSISQKEIAAHFGFTQAWVSQVLGADAVRERLAARKAELIDPTILLSFDRRLESLAAQSMELLAENLQVHRSSDTALKVLDITTRSLGYGAKAAVQVTQNFVVAMPAKAVDGTAWVEGHKPRPPIAITLDSVIDVPMTQ